MNQPPAGHFSQMCIVSIHNICHLCLVRNNERGRLSLAAAGTNRTLVYLNISTLERFIAIAIVEILTELLGPDFFFI